MLGGESIEDVDSFVYLVVRSPKMEGPRRTWRNDFKKQMVLLYNFTNVEKQQNIY